MNYLTQLRRALDHIEDHLPGSIDLQTVSRTAGISHYHFQRIFRGLTGDSLGNYVRGRRLAHARAQLAANRSVLDVALDCDYAPEAFARAFKRAYGMSPSEFRRGAPLPSLDTVPLDLEAVSHRQRVNLNPELTHRDEVHIIGLATRYDGEGTRRNTMGEDLPRLWEQFVVRMNDVPQPKPGPFYGILRNRIPGDDATLEYIAGRPVNANTVPPEGMIHCVLPAGPWAVFAHHGIPDGIDHMVNYIYGSWLFGSRQQHSGGPDIEIYGPQWEPGSPESVIHYAIPLAA